MKLGSRANSSCTHIFFYFYHVETIKVQLKSCVLFHTLICALDSSLVSPTMPGDTDYNVGNLKLAIQLSPLSQRKSAYSSTSKGIDFCTLYRKKRKTFQTENSFRQLANTSQNNIFLFSFPHKHRNLKVNIS